MILRRLFLSFFLLPVSFFSSGQPYYFNCNILEDAAILKISAVYPNQIWLITEDADSGRLYMVDENKVAYDFTDTIRAHTSSKLTTVTAVGYDTCFIGTASDYLFYFHNNTLIHLNHTNGLEEPRIVSMVDGDNGYCHLSTTHHGYYCNYWFQNFIPVNTGDFPIFFPTYDDYEKELTEVLNDTHRTATLWTNNGHFTFDTQDTMGVLTAFLGYPYYGTDGSPYWYIGSTDGIIIRPSFSPINYRALKGLTVNDIIRYHDQTMIATNNGLYYVNVSVPDSVKPVSFDLPVGSVNDLEVFGDFLLAATDHGLLWITDTAGCETFPPQFSTSVDTVQFPTNTTVQFFSCGDYNSYQWDFGDGTSGAAASPVHNYDSAGIYHVCLTAENFCGKGTTCRDLALFNTGVEEISSESSLRFYPNPFDQQTTLLGNYPMSASIKIELFDLPGNLLISFESPSISDDKLPPGIYLYRVKSHNRLIATGKLVKE